MIVNIPTPPTSNEMPPSAATPSVSTSTIDPSTSSICCCVMIVKSSRRGGSRDPLDAGDDLFDRRVLGVQHVDLERPLPVEQLEAARGGDIDRVIEIDAHHVALRLHDADDAIAQAADADTLPRRVRGAVELRVELRAEHGDVACAL